MQPTPPQHTMKLWQHRPLSHGYSQSLIVHQSILGFGCGADPLSLPCLTQPPNLCHHATRPPATTGPLPRVHSTTSTCHAKKYRSARRSSPPTGMSSRHGNWAVVCSGCGRWWAARDSELAEGANPAHSRLTVVGKAICIRRHARPPPIGTPRWDRHHHTPHEPYATLLVQLDPRGGDRLPVVGMGMLGHGTGGCRLSQKVHRLFRIP